MGECCGGGGSGRGGQGDGGVGGAMGPFIKMQPGEGVIRRNLIAKKVCLALRTFTAV